MLLSHKNTLEKVIEFFGFFNVYSTGTRRTFRPNDAYNL